MYDLGFGCFIMGFDNDYIYIHRERERKICIFFNDHLQSSCSLLSLGGVSGSGCSKLLTSLVNISLKFQTFISEICQYFLLKKCAIASFIFVYIQLICFYFQTVSHMIED